jgi:hypothetical protein
VLVVGEEGRDGDDEDWEELQGVAGLGVVQGKQ